MIRQVAPLILDAAGSVAKDAIRIYLERRIAPREEVSGTPYLDLLNSVLMAHRYAVRAKEVPTKAGLYQSLAQNELADALYTARELPRSNRHDALIHKMADARALLLQQRGDGSIDQVAKLLWDASSEVLDLAE